ncbi:MAG: hypothetical protein LBU28_02045 [Spirochaetaceae bacterium]|nr:hypothetical protein [Spirochaetaceae bacterium]
MKFLCGLLCLWLSLTGGACEYREEPVFPFFPPETETAAAFDGRLYAHSKASREGIIPLGKPVPLEYSFQDPLFLPFDASLEIAYRIVRRDREDAAYAGGDIPAGSNPAAFYALRAAYRLVLRIDREAAWELPWDGSFLGLESLPQGIAYGAPLPASRLDRFTISCEAPAGEAVPPWDDGLAFEVTAIRIIPRWYGFVLERGSPPRDPPLFLRATPFVSADMDSGRGGPVRIDPLPQYAGSGGWDLFLQGGGGTARASAVATGGARYEYPGGFGPGWYFLPAEAFPPFPSPIIITGGEDLTAVQLVRPPERSFPQAIPADPGLILDYDQERWRDRRYEVFRWDRFPSILIFDTADLAVQDRIFKRLAFFVEKTGYTGRLMTDQEMADLRGWNAHDYRAEDLAAFFETARKDRFPLTTEEQELGEILLEAGILEQSLGGTIRAGAGAVLSLSRESPDYLRSRFMAHEGFHGLFFIDEDFQEFCRRRWRELEAPARRFILSYFDYQGYNTKDSYLVINEYMAHCIQQAASQAGFYFGGTLAGRIYESSWRRTVLPPRDEAAGTWPDLVRAFSREAEALSAYVNRRWGLAAGRVSRILPEIQR